MDSLPKPSENSFEHPRKDPISHLDISIILLNTENRGNIGSVARVMKNFGFSRLILVNPLQDHLDTYAMGFACKAKDLLHNAELIKVPFTEQDTALTDLFRKFDIVIGTSAKGISFQNIKRIPVFLDDLDITQWGPSARIALVFGRESTGLTNEQILATDFLIKIPAHPAYPTLNLAQAVGIICYSLYQKLHDIEREQVIPATKTQKDRFLAIAQRVIHQSPLPEYRHERTLHALKNIIGRSFASQKELSYLYTLFKKIDLGINDQEIFAPNGIVKKRPEKESRKQKKK